jgi:hypothetical protein
MMNNSYNSNGGTRSVYTTVVGKFMMSDYFKNCDGEREEGKQY